MNNDRRKKLRKVVDRIIDLRAELLEIGEDEQFAYDNLPEALQSTTKGQKITENADAIEEIRIDLENVEDMINELLQAS